MSAQIGCHRISQRLSKRSRISYCPLRNRPLSLPMPWISPSPQTNSPKWIGIPLSWLSSWQWSILFFLPSIREPLHLWTTWEWGILWYHISLRVSYSQWYPLWQAWLTNQCLPVFKRPWRIQGQDFYNGRTRGRRIQPTLWGGAPKRDQSHYHLKPKLRLLLENLHVKKLMKAKGKL